jgi:hypothetical protein
MKIGKSEIFIGIGGILLGALAYKYFYAPKTTTQRGVPEGAQTLAEEATEDESGEESANFLGFGKRKGKAMEMAQPKGVDKIKKAYVESVKMGVSPAYATKEIATKIKRSKNPKKQKMMALAALRDVSTMSLKGASLDLNGSREL